VAAGAFFATVLDAADLVAGAGELDDFDLDFFDALIGEKTEFD
jgi:hypothetical protein